MKACHSHRLFKLYVRAGLRRFRYDFARELVLGICSLILFSLFFYIFRDFVYAKIADISKSLQETFARWGSITLLGLGTWSCSRMIRELMYESAIKKTATRFGDAPCSVRGFLSLGTLFVYSIHYIPLWYLILKYMFSWNWIDVLTWQALASAGILFACFIPPLKKQDAERQPFFLVRARSSRSHAMFVWRLKQVIYRNRGSRVVLALIVPLLGGLFLLAWRQEAFFLAVLMAYLVGFLASSLLALQLSEDLKTAWAERSMGISHDDMINTYKKLSWAFAIAAVALVLMSYLPAFGQTEDVAELLKLGPIAATCPLLMPALLFQIEGRKSGLQIASCFLLGLFLATAIFAHWLGVVLLPIASHYLESYQAGRYYRA